jgi:pyruvate dehydrogenase (quinone)
VQRCYGIVGDALNPVIDALHRNGKIEFVHVRHEEYGVFAAVAEAYFTDRPVVVCGTAGPGVTHLFNGLMDARKEGAPIIAIAGDVETAQPLQVFRYRMPLRWARRESGAGPGGD